MQRLIIFLIAAILFPNDIEASIKFERMDSNGWCSRGSKPKAPSPGYVCYKFIETNDGDPSVIFDRRKIKITLIDLLSSIRYIVVVWIDF